MPQRVCSPPAGRSVRPCMVSLHLALLSVVCSAWYGSAGYCAEGAETCACWCTSRLVRVAMENAKETWWCYKCNQPRKQSMNFCGTCGISWEKNQNMVNQRATSYRTDSPRRTYWGNPAWTNWNQPRKDPSNSPRHQPHAPKWPKQKPKQQEGKGPWNPRAEIAPAQPSAPAPSDPTPPMDPFTKNMMSLLRKNEANLPAEVQSLMHSAEVQQAQTNIKALHSAASKLGVAKKKVQEAKSARLQLHTAWKEYLQAACVRWKRFIQEFGQDDNKLEQELQKAIEELQAAKQHLDQVKESVQSEDVENFMDVEAEELQDRPLQSASIRQGMEGMVSSIDQLQRQAEDSLEAMQSATKRLKTAADHKASGHNPILVQEDPPPSDPVEPAVPSAPSMLPFGAPDYVDPWFAVDRALDLAAELGCLPCSGFPFASAACDDLRTPRARPPLQLVRFDPYAVVCIDDEDCQTGGCVRIGTDSLADWSSKPWRLHESHHTVCGRGTYDACGWSFDVPSSVSGPLDCTFLSGQEAAPGMGSCSVLSPCHTCVDVPRIAFFREHASWVLAHVPSFDNCPDPGYARAACSMTKDTPVLLYPVKEALEGLPSHVSSSFIVQEPLSELHDDVSRPVICDVTWHSFDLDASSSKSFTCRKVRQFPPRVTYRQAICIARAWSRRDHPFSHFGVVLHNNVMWDLADASEHTVSAGDVFAFRHSLSIRRVASVHTRMMHVHDRIKSTPKFHIPITPKTLGGHRWDVAPLSLEAVCSSPPLITTSDSDAVSLMQGRARVHLHPGVSVALFRRGRTWIRSICPQQPEPARLQAVAEAWNMNMEDLVGVSEIRFRLPGLPPRVHPWIVWTDDDAVHPGQQRLCICDVVMHRTGPQASHLRPSQRVRKVRKFPAIVSREDVATMRVTLFCHLHDSRCLVKHNEQMWHLQDRSLHPVHHGDWFEVFLPPEDPSPTGDPCTDILAYRDPNEDVGTEGDLDDLSNWTSQGSADFPAGATLLAPQVDDLHETMTQLCVWAIHHSHFTICPQPRIVTVGPYPDQWRAQIVQAWADQFSMVHPISIHLVFPQPFQPAIPGQQSCLHVLAEQGLQQAKRAVLVTLDDRLQQPPRHTVAAYSVPAYVSASLLATSIGLPAQLVATHSIQVRQHTSFMSFAEVVPCSAGTNYIVYRRQPEDDEVTLMQRSSAWSGLASSPEIPSSSTCPIVTEEVLSWSQPVMHIALGTDTLPLPWCLMPLLHLWTISAFVEAEQQGPVCYIQTWYVHHVHAPSCYVPRTVLLTSDLSLWLPDIINAWQEQFVWNEPFRLHVVSPKPPNSQLQSTVAHVIVEQGLQIPRVPAMFCRVAAEVLHAGCEKQFVTSVSHRMDRDDLLHVAYADLPSQDVRNVAVTQVFVHSITLERSQVVRMRGGDLVITRYLFGPPHVRHAVDGTQPVLGQFDLPIDLSRQVTFHHATHTVQLARAFDFHMIATELIDPRLKVRTWYIDHMRFEENPLFREAELTSPWQTWTQQLILVWADLIDFALDAHYAVVRPVSLPGDFRHPSVDIIVWQRPFESKRVALATLVQDGSARAWALSIPAQQSRTGLLRQVGKAATCRHLQCEVVHGSWIINDQLQFAVTDGFGFEVHIHREDPPEDDPMGLLQVSVASSEDEALCLMQNLEFSPSPRPDTDSMLLWQAFGARLDDLCWTDITLRTWFLRFPDIIVSQEFRMVDFSRSDASWRAIIEETWSDRLVSGLPTNIVFADPAFRHPGIPGLSVLLWQGTFPDRVPVLELICQDPMDALHGVTVARFVPVAGTVMDLVPITRLRAEDTLLPCIWFQGQRFAADASVALYPGAAWSTELGRSFTLEQAVNLIADVTSVPALPQPDVGIELSDVSGLMQESVSAPSVGSSTSGIASRTLHSRFLTYLDTHRSIALGSCDADPASQVLVHTYFLSPARLTSCTVARLVTLTADMATWTDKILQAWPDWVDSAGSVSLYVVFPYPVRQPSVPPSAASVLIVQDENDHDVPAFFTILHPDASLQHAAHVVDAVMTRSQLVTVAGVAMHDQPQCVVVHADHTLQDGEDWYVSPGQGFYIGIRDFPARVIPADPVVTSRGTPQVLMLSELVPEQPGPDSSSDENAFLQWPQSSCCGRLPLGDASDDTDLSSGMQLPIRQDTARLEACHDDSIPLQQRSELSWEDFDALWYQVCPAAVHFKVWYVHHEYHTRCVTPRRIRLTPDLEDWKGAIERLWHDTLTPGEPTFISVVHMAQSNIVGRFEHVILWQRPMVDKVVALHIATFAEPMISPPVLQALSCPRTVRASVLLQMVEVDATAYVLQLRYLFFRVRPELFLALTDGSTWTVSVTPRPTPDGTSLLQLRSSASVIGRPPVSKPSSTEVSVDSMEVDADSFKMVSCPGLQDLCTSLLSVENFVQPVTNLPGVLMHAQYPHDLHALVTPGVSTAVACIHIYTDGSCLWNLHDGELRAAWAMVVVYEYASGDCVIHCFANAAVSGQNQHLALEVISKESQPPNAFTAETEGLVRALLWCLSAEELRAGVPTVIHADASSVLHATDGQWSCENREFVRTVGRPLYLAAQQLGSLTTHWQKAHCHHCFNDLADSLAKQAARCDVATPMPFPFTDAQVPLLGWVWLALQAQVDNVGVHFKQDAFAFPIPPELGTADLDVWPRHVADQQSQLSLSLRFATFNVESLKQWTCNKAAGSWSSRSELLRAQGHDHHFLCLQETRGTQDTTWQQAGWFGFCAAAENGHGGCELWFNTTVSFACRGGTADRPDRVFFDRRRDEISLPKNHDDHVSVSLDVCVDLSVVRWTPLIAPVRFSRVALCTDDGQQIAGRMLRAFEGQWKDRMWTMSLDQHALQLHQWFASQLVEAFPLESSKPRQSWLSDHTVRLLMLSRCARRAIGRSRLHFQRACLAHMHSWFMGCFCVQYPRGLSASCSTR
eukprot:Skav202712  [mRNA]  locus=scaffold654:654744:664175:+ [translate_table: standard]